MTMSWVAEAVATIDCSQRHHPRRGDGVLRAEEQQRRDEQELRKYQPAAPVAEHPTEHRDLKCIDQRRPQELDGVRRADQREQADGLEIDADILHPQQERGS